MAISPNMGLPIDTPSVTTGPAWATDNEARSLLVDSHTHVSGQGLPVPTAGLNINSTIPMAGFGLSNAGTLGLTSQATTSSGTANLFFNSGGNVYWNNASGVPIQLTSGNAINAASIGGITGLSGTTGAWTYSQALTTFIGTADTNKSAAIDVGAATIRETNVASAKGVKLTAPAGLGTNYTLTLPTGLPAASGLLLMDTSGNTSVVSPRVPVSTLLPCNQFHVYRNAAQSMPPSAYSIMFSDKVLKDVGNGYSIANGWYQLPSDGDWVFSFVAGAQYAAADGQRLLETDLVVNSGNALVISAVSVSGTNTYPLAGTYLYLNGKAGDKVQVQVYNSSASARNMVTSSGFCQLQGFQLR